MTGIMLVKGQPNRLKTIVTIRMPISCRSLRTNQMPSIMPVSAVPAAAPQSEPLVVSVTETGSYLVNGRELINSSPDTLRTALLKQAGGNRDLTVTIRADHAPPTQRTDDARP